MEQRIKYPENVSWCVGLRSEMSAQSLNKHVLYTLNKLLLCVPYDDVLWSVSWISAKTVKCNFAQCIILLCMKTKLNHTLENEFDIAKLSNHLDF